MTNTYTLTITHASMGDCGTYTARTETEALVKHWNDVGYAVGYDADEDEPTNLEALNIYSDGSDPLDFWGDYNVEQIDA